MKDLQELIKEKRLIIGTDRVLKMLKNEQLTNISIASNCPENVKEDIKHYSKIFNVKLVELKETNQELGIICKKPFSISVIGW